MSRKQNRNSIYILLFSDRDFIKIGISKNLPLRIKKFKKEYNSDFILAKSFIIGSYSSTRISALEKELLATTLDFKIKDNDLIEFSQKDGVSEIRYKDCLPIILKLINYKLKLFPMDYYLYKGLSLEKNLLADLPKEIFNSNGETSYSSIEASDNLIEIIKTQITDFKELNNEEIVNSVLAKFILNNKLKIPKSKKEESYVRKKDKHYAYEFRGKWVWVERKSDEGKKDE